MSAAEDARDVGIRRVRHRRRLALEHHCRARGVRRKPWRSAGLARLADSWRKGYLPAMDRVRRGELPWTKIDDLHRMILDDLLRDAGITSVSDADVDHLNRAWHRLDPWPDSVAGLTRLKERFVITTLSNGNVSLLTNMAKRAGLPWDCVISAELFHHYKPDLEAYLGCADLLDVAPDELMLVAAHPGDLRAGPRCRTDDRLCRPSAGVRPQSASSQVRRRRIRLHGNGFSGSCRPTRHVSRGVAWKCDRPTAHRTPTGAAQGAGPSRRPAGRSRRQQGLPGPA